MTVVATGLITRVGRRTLFLISQLLCCLSITALGVYFYIQETDKATADTIGWLPLASLMIYIGSFAVGSGPIPWVMTGEIVPRKVKSNRNDLFTTPEFADDSLMSFSFSVYFRLGRFTGYVDQLGFRFHRFQNVIHSSFRNPLCHDNQLFDCADMWISKAPSIRTGLSGCSVACASSECCSPSFCFRRPKTRRPMRSRPISAPNRQHRKRNRPTRQRQLSDAAQPFQTLSTEKKKTVVI